MNLFDYLTADRFSPLGDTPFLLVDAAEWVSPDVPLQAIIIGLDDAGALPNVDEAAFDLLLTTASNPPKPWVCASCDTVMANVRANPHAASVLCQTLRLIEKLPVDQGFAVESLAYSALLAGDEFRRWRAANPANAPVITPDNPVKIERDTGGITIILDDPASHNATNAAMRDALFEALANALDDPTRPSITLKSNAKCFSTGGDLAEFGQSDDLAKAHAIRLARSPARLLTILENRATTRFNGAAIGAGLEIGAASKRRISGENAWFQLPELAMGLIPGAGGTVTVSRAIGRHRTAYMVLSGRRITAQTALEWSLIDAIKPPL